MKSLWKKGLSVALFILIIAVLFAVFFRKEKETYFEEGMDESSDLEGKTIASVILLEDQTEKVMQTAMRVTAEKYGVHVVEGQSGGELERETNLINKYVEQGVDAICIYPVSPTGSLAVLENAAKKGISVYSVDQKIDSDWFVGYCEADQYNIGQLVGNECAAYIKKNIPDRKAKVAIIEFSALIPETSESRTKGFLSVTEDLIEVVQDVDAWDADTATPIVKDVLDANPDLDILFCANEGGTVGAVMAVQNAGLDIPVFGIDITEQLINMMLDERDILQALGGQDPVQLGQKSMENLCNSLLGNEYDTAVTIPGLILSRHRPEEAKEYIEMTQEILQQSIEQ